VPLLSAYHVVEEEDGKVLSPHTPWASELALYIIVIHLFLLAIVVPHAFAGLMLI